MLAPAPRLSPDISPPRHEDTKKSDSPVKNAIPWTQILDNLSKRYNAKTFRNVRSVLNLVSLCLGGDEQTGSVPIPKSVARVYNPCAHRLKPGATMVNYIFY